MAAKNVTVIPATINPHTRMPDASIKKRRVAGYARVSTDSDEQFTSYEAQVDYYTTYIKSHPEWEFVAVYTDEGISGLGTRRREGFNRMIADALAGRIDLIVTKSVSRFARNTVDSLSTIRKLKENGTEVYFEKENIFTFDGKGELLITLMSSLAQEESRSISENVTWGQRKRMADGKVSMPYKGFLGYRKGSDGLPEIDPEQAEIVRRIYRMFMDGLSISRIAKTLTSEGIPTPRGKQNWQKSVVESILSNEKYKGDARLQKKFTTDFLTKKMKVNEGEVPQYYVKNSHPAIIAPKEWDQVQNELQRRKTSSRQRYCSSAFSGKIYCGECGGVYGAKVWHSTDQYRRIIWQCNGKFKGEKKCTTPHLTEEQILSAFRKAVSLLVADRTRLIDDIQTLRERLTDTSEIECRLSNVDDEIVSLTALTDKYIRDNAVLAQDQDEYRMRFQELSDRYDALKENRDKILAELQTRQIKVDALEHFIRELETIEAIDFTFTPQRWNAIVDMVTVSHDDKLTFRFNGGNEIEIQI